jgi:hypothetical protein
LYWFPAQSRVAIRVRTNLQIPRLLLLSMKAGRSLLVNIKGWILRRIREWVRNVRVLRGSVWWEASLLETSVRREAIHLSGHARRMTGRDIRHSSGRRQGIPSRGNAHSAQLVLF